MQEVTNGDVVEAVIDNVSDEAMFSAYDITTQLREDGFYAEHNFVKSIVHDLMGKIKGYDVHDNGEFLLYYPEDEDYAEYFDNKPEDEGEDVEVVDFVDIATQIFQDTLRELVSIGNQSLLVDGKLFPIDQVLEFDYTRGHHIGNKRVVKVTNVESDRIYGEVQEADPSYDASQSNVRNFVFEAMSNVSVV